MRLEIIDLIPFSEWLPTALAAWVKVAASVAAGIVILAWLLLALRYGPKQALRRMERLLADAAVDLVQISPRRVWALASLAIQESIRRRVVVVFAVFILLLLFAGWFLDPGSEDPARLYLSFVLTATSYLVLLLALILSSLSLPADIKNRTLHTVVTKPVRTSEVVLGRIVGFAVVGSLLLLIMGTISYGFVVRGLAHTHQLTADDLQPAEALVPDQPPVLRGYTSRNNGHRHKVSVAADGQGIVELEKGHWHRLTLSNKGPKYLIGPAEGTLLARVPIYGKLSFRDNSGQPEQRGISVGDEDTYRSYIRGGTLAAAVWSFDGVTEKAFPNGLPIELNIGVFRTYKGTIEKGVLGSLSLRNPKTDKKVEVRVFESKEFVIDVQKIPPTFVTSKGESVDLFKDIVADGQLEVWLQCVQDQQYFGAGEADLYLRAKDAFFALNFARAYVGIWLQMVIVIALGVMFSTFLSGSVAMLATLGALAGGMFNDFMFRLATNQTFGGGPFESIMRMVTQHSITGEMDPSPALTVAQTLDQWMAKILLVLASILPDFGRFSFADYVASGFNVSGDTILTFTCRALAFVFPVFVVGYFCLRTREVGQS